MSQYKIIVNPISGRGNGERIIPLLQEQFKAHQVEFDLTRTERPLHAIELAKQAVVDGYSVVVAVGGDGTANEVINGLMQAKQDGLGNQVAMGVLAAGRGNDFAYGVGMPDDLETSCRVLTDGHSKTIDVGHVFGGQFPEGRYFGNSVGIGFDAVVGFEAVKMTRLSGIPSYLVAVLKTVFLYYKAPKVQIEHDEQITTMRPLMISIMNGQRQGGTFFMSPEAKNSDGLLDLCVVEQVSRARIFTLIPHFIKGSQFGQKEVKFEQTARLVVTAVEGVLPAHCDGETLCTEGTKLEVVLLPGRLDVICPVGEKSSP
jgi:YegS/Rv2252/BmrU family lipid kinase